MVLQAPTSTACFLSSFTPRAPIPSRNTPAPALCSPDRALVAAVPSMAAPKHVRRTEEIQRLTKQLEQLRQKRDQMISSKKEGNLDTNTTASLPSASSQTTASSPPNSFQLGKHATGNRFLSISSVDSEEYHPRILLIAGAVPDLTTDQFRKVPQMLYNREPAKGNLFLCRLPDGYTGEFVSMMTYDALAKCGDPVAVLIEPHMLSASKLPITPNDDVVLVVDRDLSGSPFRKTDFYAWDVNGKVQIGWSDYEPPADVASRIGKVIYGHIEIDKELRVKKSCWEEENETYM